MGKGRRLKKKRKPVNTKERDFSREFSEVFAQRFQKELCNSGMWDEMVAEYGEEKARELLQSIKADIYFPDDVS